MKEDLLIRTIESLLLTRNEKKRDMHTVVESFTREMEERGIKVETQKVSVTKSHTDINIANLLRGSKDGIFAYFMTNFKLNNKFSLKNSDSKIFYKYLSSININIVNNQEVIGESLPNHEAQPCKTSQKYTYIETNSIYR